MPCTNDFENDHSKPNGGAKTIVSLKGGAQIPVADMEKPHSVEADQDLSSKEQDKIEATKDNIRELDDGKEADKQAKAQADGASEVIHPL